MAEHNAYDVIIIGGGVAGLGAALYSGRFELKTLLISENVGGTIINTNEVANYPGFEMISGIELTEKLHKHAEKYKAEFVYARVDKLEKKKSCFIVHTKGKEYLAKTLIIATGTEWKKLKVPGEKEFTGKGVHYCALCDGAFYNGKVVAVIGGSDSAVKDALLLTEYAKKVYIIYRKEKLRAEPITCDSAYACKKIEVIHNTNVTAIKGEKFVNKVILDNEYNGSKEFPLDGVFIDIGHTPVAELAKMLGVKLNEKSEIIIDRHGLTNLEGVFAAGDVTDGLFKQAITGVGEGVRAAYNAYKYVNRTQVICTDE